ncbi:unnamed protein product [Linum tenue]|uniref:Uncharacterized protein n=1 Tax=Linum tenue TaxID=586396 RepID=A0AAV0KHF0_9ROSI|nr:unnamed protein product [Linum tenue]
MFWFSPRGEADVGFQSIAGRWKGSIHRQFLLRPEVLTTEKGGRPFFYGLGLRTILGPIF